MIFLKVFFKVNLYPGKVQNCKHTAGWIFTKCTKHTHLTSTQIQKQNITCIHYHAFPLPKVIVFQFNSAFMLNIFCTANDVDVERWATEEAISLEIRRGKLKKLTCNRVTGISHLLDLMKFILKSSFLIIQCETDR